MSRIEGVPAGRAGLLGRVAYWVSKRRFGKVVEPLAVTAHHKWILRAMGAYEFALERADRVDRKLKTLAAVKPATLVGCKFCIDIGSAIAGEAGVTERQMAELLTYRESDAFSELEKTVIDYAAAMTRTPVEVSDELFDRLRRHMDDEQIVELTAEIAWENYRARFNHALGIGSQGFSEKLAA